MTAANTYFLPDIAQADTNTLQCRELKQLVGPCTQRKELPMPLVLAITSILLVAPSLALASELTPKQQKMQACNAEAQAKGLRGDEQQKFMSACLSAKAPETKGAAQQAKKK
jgi:psiF repeat-containing protein